MSGWCMRLLVPAWLDSRGAFTPMALKQEQNRNQYQNMKYKIYLFQWQNLDVSKFHSDMNSLCVLLWTYLEVCITSCEIFKFSCCQFQIVSCYQRLLFGLFWLQMANVVIPRQREALQPYILKVEVLEVRTPQIIWIFRKILVWERENYQLCSIEFCHREQEL